MKQDMLGLHYFNSGLAAPVNGLSIDQVSKILQACKQVQECKILNLPKVEPFLSVKLNKALTTEEVLKLKEELRDKGVIFEEDRKPLSQCSSSY